MRIAYFDCFSGTSGDMILGACLGAGLSLDKLRRELAGLNLPGFAVDARQVRKGAFAATQFEVQQSQETHHPHRHLHHVREILDKSSLSVGVREQAFRIFTRLAEAEAAVHGTTVEQVHFHEVGAIDAIVDIVGACIAVEALQIDRICCSPIPTGSGTVQCSHGEMPVPAPATAALLLGVPLAACDEPGELTTPTGAAILSTLAASFGPLPAMTLEKIGVGAGQREGRNRANVLRLLIGQATEPDRTEVDQVIVLEANLDDVTAEVIGYVYDRLLSAGALDVYTTPLGMKKSRPGTLLSVLAPPNLREKIEEILFAETSTFGIRSWLAERRKLARERVTVQTEMGPIRVKIGRRGGKVIRVSPEYEDCRVVAERTGRPLAEIMQMVTQAWAQQRT